MVRAVLALFSALSLAACLSSPPEATERTQAGILGGVVAKTCEWPSVVVLLPSGCSAVLVHRQVIATAAHCLYGIDGRLEVPTQVVFGEQLEAPAAERTVDTCFVREGQDGDLAICVLQEQAPDIPIAPLMAPCEDAWLAPGQTAVEVGFGDRSLDPPRETGVKGSLDVAIVRARTGEAYLEVSAGSQAGEYYGDSGGPLVVSMPDGTWRVAGIDSGSPAIIAGSDAPRFSVYSSMPSLVDWAEGTTGIDLTPCHDQGFWRPGPDCSRLPIAAAPATDSWRNQCGEQPVAAPQATCSVDETPAPHGELRAAGGCSLAGTRSSSFLSLAPLLVSLLAYRSGALRVLRSPRIRRGHPARHPSARTDQ